MNEMENGKPGSLDIKEFIKNEFADPGRIRSAEAIVQDCENAFNKVRDAASAGIVASTNLRDLRVVELLPSGALRVYPAWDGGYDDIPTGPGQELKVSLRLNSVLVDLSKSADKDKGTFVLVNASRLNEKSESTWELEYGWEALKGLMKEYEDGCEAGEQWRKKHPMKTKPAPGKRKRGRQAFEP